MLQKQSLQNRIFTLSVSLILVPVVLYSIFTIVTTVQSAQKNFEDYMTLSTRDIGATVENVFNEIDRTSLFIISSYDIINYLSLPSDRLSSNASLMLSSYNQQRYAKSSSMAVHAIQIQGTNSVVMFSGPLPMNITEKDIQLAESLKGQSFWGVEPKFSSKDFVYLCRAMFEPKDSTRELGIIKLYLDSQYLRNIINAENDPASYYLLDGAGETILSVNPLASGTPKQQFDEINFANMNGRSVATRIDGVRYYAAPYVISTNGWVLVKVARPTAADQQIVAGIVFLISLTVVCILLVFLLADFLSKRSIEPLHEVIQKMKLIENEDFAARIDVKGEGEVAELATQFNQMASKINSLVDEVYKENIQKKEAELRALQAQINPHFLYNTLDMVYWTAKMENAVETSDMINSLSHFFRSGLSLKGELTQVKNELEHLRYYIILMQQKEKSFEFSLEQDADTADCKTVKLVLQPLVENAMIHGISDMEDGQIKVSILHVEENLIYRIEDNGKGIDVSEMEQLMINPLESTRGLGTRNVHDRIQLAFGNAYGLRFEERQGGGTIVTVTMPYLKDNE